MKQVTMESVKQRIADLESAGKVVGGLSLSSEFELSCLRELVAVTEQRDASISAERTWETTMMEACGEDGPASVAAEIKALREQRDALVAENAVIDSERLAWAELYGDEMGDPDVIEKAKALQKPATDAARAALRAEGVEMLAERRKKAADIARQLDDLRIADSLEGEAIRAQMFAKELRESKGEVSNG